MSCYTLGIDTSNYATSLAVFDTAGEVVCAKKRFLPVKEGQLGLRQSDALFHHTAALPEMLEELGHEFDLTQIAAVGVSQKPRPVEGSYMPCFLAGVNAATAFALARGIPLIRATHLTQQLRRLIGLQNIHVIGRDVLPARQVAIQRYKVQMHVQPAQIFNGLRQHQPAVMIP